MNQQPHTHPPSAGILRQAAPRAARDVMTAAAAPATAPATARYAGRCFIVVDDNEVNRVVLERML